MMSTQPKLTLIDDDSICNFVSEMAIRCSGFATDISVSNKPACAMACLRSIAETKPESFPDLIFLDLNMPVMDGWDCLDALSQLPEVFEKSKVVILSSSVCDADIIRASNYRIVLAFVSKPLTSEKIADLLLKFDFALAA